MERLLSHKKLEKTDSHNQLINFTSDERHVIDARHLEEENKLIQAAFEYVRYGEKEEVAM